MMRGALLLLLVATVSVALASSVCELSGSQTRCRAPKTSNVKVVLRTKQNGTGHWVSTVGVKQRANSEEGSEAAPWMVDVEQTTETCDNTDSVLETVFHLSAPTSTLRRPTKGSPSRSAPPEDCDCPRCPDPPPCPATTPTPEYFRSDARGYEHYPGVGSYKVSLHAETWLEAKRTCEYDGAHLLILNSQKEADAIKSLLNHYPTATGSVDNGHIFLGAQRIGDTYFTVSGGDLDSTGYVRWNPGQPGGGSEMCMTVYRPAYLFHDITCSVRLGFVCEQFPKT